MKGGGGRTKAVTAAAPDNGFLNEDIKKFLFLFGLILCLLLFLQEWVPFAGAGARRFR